MRDGDPAPVEGPNTDLLYGVQAIADHLGMTFAQTQHLTYKGEIPTFKIGKVNCSTRSGLAQHFAAKLQAAN